MNRQGESLDLSVILVKKKPTFFQKKERDIAWENKYRYLQGYWFGDEKTLEREGE